MKYFYFYLEMELKLNEADDDVKWYAWSFTFS